MQSTKEQAINRLKRAFDAIPALQEAGRSATGFTKWHRDTQIVIEHTFGGDSRHAQDFNGIEFTPGIVMSGMPDTVYQDAYQRGLRTASGILESMVDEVHEYWPADIEHEVEPSAIATTSEIVTNRVFVVHGRDEEAKQTTARFLESLGLEPIILQEQASQGNTIIEKFEEHAQSARFAVALCTPDDVGALAGDRENLKPRMRQNVVFELGYFAGAIGRNRVCALMKGNIERPSDYDGVVYIPLDNNDGWKLSLARELSAAGFEIDLNRIL